MRRPMIIGVLSAVALAGATVPGGAAPSPAVAYVVSPDGDDAAPGTRSQPFASLERAQAAVRSAVAEDSGAVTVYVREGTYRRTDTLEFAEADSGTQAHPVTWTAYRGESAVISGGLSLEPADFQPVDDAIRQRLRPEARDAVVQLDLAAAGVTDVGEIEQSGFALPQVAPPPELFVDDEAQTLARYPNDAMLTVGEVIDPGGNAREVMDDPEQVAIEMAKPATFGYDDARPESWASTEDVWMYGYWFHDWADGNLPLASVDATTQTLTTGASSYYSIKAGQRFYYYNVLEELDAAGEYYIDRQTATLYYFPGPDFADTTVELSLTDAPLLTFTGAHDVRVEGLAFQNGRSDAIRAYDSDRLTFRDVTLERFGQMAIVFGQRVGDRDDVGRWNVGIDGGTGNSVEHATIAHTGTGGVFLGGGDRQTLTAGGNRVIDSDISEFSRLKRTYSAAVEVAGVGNTVRGNHLHDAPHLAVYLHGNDHHIVANSIQRVMQETGDGGAIYLGRDFTETGHVIERNYISDVDNTIASGPKVGIYLDDLASGLTVRDNVIHGAGRAFLIGGGRENLIERNVIIGASERSVHLDARGMSFGAPHLQPGGTLVAMLAKVPYQSEPWASRYPWLPGVMENHTEAPVNTRLIGNVVVDSPEFYIEPAAEPYVVQRGNVQLGRGDLDALRRAVPPGPATEELGLAD